MKKIFQKIHTKSAGSHIISCEQAAFLVSKKQHKRLRFGEFLSLRMHRMVCGVCKLYEKEINLISRKIAEFMKAEKKQELDQQVRLPESKKREMADAIHNHLQQ